MLQTQLPSAAYSVFMARSVRSSQKRIIAVAAVIVVVAAASVLTWYGLWEAHKQASPAPPPNGNSEAAQSMEHVVIVMEENKPPGSIVDSTDAPYLNSLIKQYALAVNYRAITHPSLPNYIALTSGTTAGIHNDCNPPGQDCAANVPNIADSIEKSGRSWKVYAEDMPAPCYANNSGGYAVKHNPFMYYPSITGNAARCQAHVVPFTQFQQDLHVGLPNYSFIVPNLCNDMHDCLVRTGDDWLARNMPAILQSPAFTAQRSLLVITWDEDDAAENKVAAIFAGSAAKSGYRSDVSYNHYALLRTIENAWGMAPLAENDKAAPAMSDMLK